MGIGCLLDGDFRIVCRQGPFAQGSALQPGRPRTAIAVTALRDSLTVLAILLIGVLTAALVGPYLIDWDAHRALVEHRLSEAAGVPVTVAGPIDLKILPTPRLAFGDVAIGDGKAGRPRLRVGELQAEVSFTALLRGQVQVVDTTLVRPRLELAQAPDGTVDVAPAVRPGRRPHRRGSHGDPGRDARRGPGRRPADRVARRRARRRGDQPARARSRRRAWSGRCRSASPPGCWTGAASA